MTEFTKRYYPNSLKIAKVLPLYKSGDPEQQGNYRLISLLPSINKPSEKIQFNQMYKLYFEIQKIEKKPEVLVNALVK